MLKLGGERKEMSFLFMDIVGFTPISEHYKNNDDPEGLCEVINDYLDRMTKIVQKKKLMGHQKRALMKKQIINDSFYWTR